MTIVKWKQNMARFATGQHCKLGNWTVGSWYYDSSRPRDSTKMYAANLTLPGIKSEQGHWGSADEAKTRIERVVRYWVLRADIETEGCTTNG